MVPAFAENPNVTLVWVAYVAALVPLTSFLLFAELGWLDYRFTSKTIH
jgi:hypothetical protein